MSYNKKILEIRKDFLNTLYNDVSEAILNTKNIDKKELNNKIRKSVYTFIFRNVSKNIEGKKKVEEYYWELFYKTVDFVMDFGFVILNTLAELKEYKEMEKHEASEGIDA